jgi:hypothetical protein
MPDVFGPPRRDLVIHPSGDTLPIVMPPPEVKLGDKVLFLLGSVGCHVINIYFIF